MEKETVFSSKIKYYGIFSFKDYYKFCYDWLKEETQISKFSEDKYSEKLAGENKEIEVVWTCLRDLSDYFRMEVKVEMNIKRLTQVKIKKDGAEVETNKGEVEMKVKGTMIKDYLGKFDVTGFRKFLRSVYEKHVIPNTVDELKTKISTECDEFLGQAKSYLDIEGRSS